MADNMLKNGDFEEGPYIFPGTPWGVLVPPLDEDDPACGPLIDFIAIKTLSPPRREKGKIPKRKA